MKSITQSRFAILDSVAKGIATGHGPHDELSFDFQGQDGKKWQFKTTLREWAGLVTNMRTSVSGWLFVGEGKGKKAYVTWGGYGKRNKGKVCLVFKVSKYP